MQRLGKKFYILLISFFIIFFGFLTFFYYQYQQSLLEDNYESQLVNNMESHLEFINNEMNSFKDQILKVQTEYNDYDFDYYLESLESLKPRLQFSFLASYNDTSITINEFTYQFKTDMKSDNENLKTREFSFYQFNDLVSKLVLEQDSTLVDPLDYEKTYFFLSLKFQEQNYIVGYEIDFINKYLSKFENISYYFMVEKDGKIGVEKDSITDKSLFTKLYKENTEHRVNEYQELLERDESGLLKVNLFDENSYIALKKLDSNYYFIEVYARSLITDRIESNAIISIIYFGFIILSMVLIIFVLSLILKRYNDDLEISRLKYLYSKPYIIYLTKAYRIRSVNKAFKKDFPNWKKNRELKDVLVLSKDKLEYSLQKEAKVTIEYEDKRLFFNILRSVDKYTLIGIDTTKFIEEFELARKHAYINEMTGLPNYLAFEKDIDNLKSDKQFTTVLVDVDHFRNLNKLYGRSFSDELIKKIAEDLEQEFINEKRKIYQIGIDRFILYIEDIIEDSEVDSYANSIIKHFHTPISILGIRLNIKIKLGIYIVKEEDTKFSDILANMEIALKKIKESRTINYCLYNLSLGQGLTREQVLEQDLANGIKNNEFKMFYQPQYNNELNKIVSFEALIRWDNPKYINESPQLYIEIAERTNMIFDIGKIVKDNTFRFAKEMEKYGIVISINVSPSELLEVGFVEQIKDYQKKYDLDAKSIAIEITETVLMESFDEVLEKIKILKNMGFKIHLDDFGTGYSSMLYLKNLPFDTLKIDKEFIKTINTDKYSKVIVSKIISLARSLDMDVIAEGVEDDKQNQFLYKNGCNIIQGFLVSRAVDEENAEKMIEDYNITKNKTIKSVK